VTTAIAVEELLNLMNWTLGFIARHLGELEGPRLQAK
jgi:hypothetical protein